MPSHTSLLLVTAWLACSCLAAGERPLTSLQVLEILKTVQSDAGDLAQKLEDGREVPQQLCSVHASTDILAQLIAMLDQGRSFSPETQLQTVIDWIFSYLESVSEVSLLLRINRTRLSRIKESFEGYRKAWEETNERLDRSADLSDAGARKTVCEVADKFKMTANHFKATRVTLDRTTREFEKFVLENSETL